MTMLDQTDLAEMVSYRRNVTGVSHTLFISPKGNARHGPRIKVAIDPPDRIDPRTQTCSVTFDGVALGDINHDLLHEVRRFVELNREVLLDFWHYRIDTDELRTRLRAI
jgi:hypothetical protein